MHELCANSVVMQVNLERIVSTVTYTAYAVYTGFNIGDLSTNYTLSASYSSGNGKIINLSNY